MENVKARSGKKGIRITEKDHELIKLVEKWGFLTALDVQLMNGLSASAVQWRANRLAGVGMLKREKIILTGEFAYLPREARRNVNIMEFEHDQTVKRLAVYLKTEAQYNPEAPKVKDIITEKQLRHEAAFESGIIGLSRKVPDFIIVAEDGFKMAVEVELTAKHKPRLTAHIKKCGEAIIKNQFSMILYVCSTEAIKKRIDAETAAQGLQSCIRTALLPPNIINYTGGWPWLPETEI